MYLINSFTVYFYSEMMNRSDAGGKHSAQTKTPPEGRDDNPPSRQPPQVSESDPSSSVSNSDPSSDDDSLSDDDMVPAFVTCDKCGLVLANVEPALEHERRCQEDIKTMVLFPIMKVFTNKDALIDFLIDHSERNGGDMHLRESDEVYYHGPPDAHTTRLGEHMS